MARKQIRNTETNPIQPAEKQRTHQSLRLRLDDLKTVDPLTENQKKFFDLYNQDIQAFVLCGSPGTGKTFLSMCKALESVLEKSTVYDQLIIIRNAIPTTEIGHLPGDLSAKNAAYEEPYQQICADLFGRGDAYSRLKEQKHLEFVNASYLRGMTFDNSIVFFEEFQNANWHVIKSVISRLGVESKLILSGDHKQTDLTRKHGQSGFFELLQVAQEMKEFAVIKFTTDDIIRSAFTKNFIIACEKLDL